MGIGKSLFSGKPATQVVAAPETSSADFQGHVDRVQQGSIEGWAWHVSSPDLRASVSLYDGDEPLATVRADIERSDLASAGIGDGRHGFRFNLAGIPLAQGPHRLRILCAATGAELPDSPFELDITAPPAEAPFRFYFDQVADGGFSGWIAPRHGALRQCSVALKVDGEIVQRALAAQFRSDLLDAGIGDGYHGFTLSVPPGVSDVDEYQVEIIEEETGFMMFENKPNNRAAPGGEEGKGLRLRENRAPRPDTQPTVRVMFDISDLVYYLGEHNNLTGIQRVQSSVILAMLDGELLPLSSILFLSFNVKAGSWLAVPKGYVAALLRDLFLPEGQRTIPLPHNEAKQGILPGAQTFDGAGVLDDGTPSVLCLMGAAWVQRDYVRRLMRWKRLYGTRFVMTVHDLIPIYARETCDQDTVRVFEEFMLRALPHVDHVLAVSEYTAKDVRRYLSTLRIPEPAISVTRNGSSFAEFLPKRASGTRAVGFDIPERFVLFVATIEGRKNHKLMLDIWQRMTADGDDPPHLVCVGRLGWKATSFLNPLIESNYLNGKVRLLREVSDLELRTLYERCLFTLSPTFYEGWGLPVGESLAMGKVCVCSRRSSMPEVGGDCAVYIDIDDVDHSLSVVRSLILDDAARLAAETKVRTSYVPISWRSVAERVVAACRAATSVTWSAPYPNATLPLGTEVAFGSLNNESNYTGELLLRTAISSRQPQLQLGPLNMRNFLLGEEVRFGGNWAAPESWGTWMCDSRGAVAFTSKCETGQIMLVLRLRVPEPLFQHPVRILVNGEELWFDVIGGSSRNILLCSRSHPDATGSCRIEIQVSTELSAELTRRITALDARMPVIGFERLIAVQESDIGSRLNLLTRLMTAP